MNELLFDPTMEKKKSSSRKIALYLMIGLQQQKVIPCGRATNKYDSVYRIPLNIAEVNGEWLVCWQEEKPSKYIFNNVSETDAVDTERIEDGDDLDLSSL
jgi:hypothetical protein